MGVADVSTSHWLNAVLRTLYGPRPEEFMPTEIVDRFDIAKDVLIAGPDGRTFRSWCGSVSLPLSWSGLRGSVWCLDHRQLLTAVHFDWSTGIMRIVLPPWS